MAVKKGELVQDFYAGIDKETAGRVIYRTEELKKKQKDMHASIIESAQLVFDNHFDLAKVGNGKFSEWVRREAPFSRQTAYKLLDVQKLGSCKPGLQLLGDLGGLEKVEVSALYELAKPSTPQEVIEEAAKEVKKGKSLTASSVKKLLKDRELEKEPEADPEDFEAAAQEEEAEESPELTPEERMDEAKKAIESFCRQLTKDFKEKWPSDPWTDAIRDTSEQSLKKLLGFIRACKGERVCPKCVGNGCKICKQIGWVDKSTSVQLN